MRNCASYALVVLTLSSTAFGQEVSANTSGTTAAAGPIAAPFGSSGDTFAAPNGQLGAGLSISREGRGAALYGELGLYTQGDSECIVRRWFTRISQRLWSVSAILGGGYKIAPNLELEAMLPIAFY